ncbi:RNA 2',3'-cyclic phosphodiesterase [Sphingomonas sp. Leaf20]|uniref:RNA 2',3'-cyclic phosphodiesterase n=1 Tax=Sphingomonas sp. Leaf20 TaxID=1735685 RepID=UPI0006FB6BE7|nr:RNA 2',3'-cyclic phosphodiesterase [Sphingomonas sp. Leaf20]KQM70556.1 2'-5' RNA ligase [Sphingomonas sp. Leaf20]
MIRLFVALRPPRSVRDGLLDVMDGVAGARWQDDEQLHVTLRFIGEVERAVAEDVADVLAQVHADAPTVAIAGVGTFEKRGRIDTLWAGIKPAAPLAALHRKIDHALVRVGIAPERRAYLPHLTIARLARSLGDRAQIEAWIARNAALASDPFVLPHLILYRSHLDHAGATYEPVARWPLVTRSEPGDR